jgi:formate C-acetyltransferase
VCDAGIALGRRHAELARRLAREAADPDERGRLESIAAVCARVPEYGARSLREAVQALWFAHVLTCAEDSINANSIGRLDQILQPYYQADLDAGALAPDDALELMEDLACKLYLDYDVQQICLGGQTPDGRDAANAMTCLILEATRRLGFIRCISVRLHARSPEPLVRAAAELVCEGGGIPFFFNDEAVIRALTDRGIALEDARDYAPIGCVEITIPGRANPHAVSGWLNAAKCLELALFDGVDPSTGQRFGPSTGPFASHESFESLLAAFRQQLDDFTQRMVYWCNRGELAQAERGPLPCWSTLTDHCIERGRDITDGGAKYVYHSIAFLGVPDAADALAAIRRLIYEERQVLPVDLLAALKADFKGYEALRGMLLSRAEKYGNDADGVDRLAADICRHFIETMDGFRSPLGGRYFVHLFSFVCNLTFGLSTGALPDGRRAGEPLAYSLSPHQGRDQEGVTAMMKSLAKIPHHLAAGSSAAIIELDPALVRGAAGVDRMASLIRTGVAMGIGQMQFNVVTAEALEKALADPERYGNIQVRVAGYSSKFRLLNRPLQEHIIARTKHRQ